MDYRIIEFEDHAQLEEAISALLKGGTTLVGGPFVVKGYQYYRICQAVLIPDSSDKQKEM